jgi:hypothetical protein
MGTWRNGGDWKWRVGGEGSGVGLTEPFVYLIRSLFWSEQGNVEVQVVRSPLLQLASRRSGVQVEVNRHEVAASFDAFGLELVGERDLGVVFVIRVVLTDDHDTLSAVGAVIEFADGTDIVWFEKVAELYGGDEAGDGVDVGYVELRVVDVEDGGEWKG